MKNKLGFKTAFFCSAVIAISAAIITFFAIVPRGTLLFPIGSYLNDDVRYLSSAQTLLKTGVYSHLNLFPSVWSMPGLTFLLLPFVAFWGETATTVICFKLFQIALLPLFIFLIGEIARTVFNTKISKFAMLVSALYVPFWVCVNTIFTEFFFTLFLLIMIYFLFQKKFYFSAIFWACAAYFRPTIAAFALIVFLFFVLKKYKKIWQTCTICALIFAAILSPWWVRNYVVFHKFIPFTVASGVPLHEGVQPRLKDLDSEAFAERNTEMRESIDYPNGELDYDANEIAAAKEDFSARWSENKWALIKWYLFDKIIAFWKAPHFNARIENDFYNTWGFMLHFFIVISSLLSAFFLKKAANQPRFPEKILIFLTPIYFTIIHIPFSSINRFVFPAMPFAIMLSVWGISRLVEWVKTGA